MAEAFDGVEQGELGAGVGAFAAHDQAGALGPALQVHQFGDLDDLGAVADAAAGVAGGFPVFFLYQQQGVADPSVDPVAQGEAEVAVPAFLGNQCDAPAESVRTTRDFRASAGSSPGSCPAGRVKSSV
ncbi:MAG TPA: hypothetical protein VFI47_00095 [Acidimicrobiales bacterium]|nr:hypothetical protein [Acidimicrobiales bacterium]